MLTIHKLKQLSTPLKDFNFHQAWAVVSALIHFLLHDVHGGIWTNVDDGKRVNDLTGLVGCAFLSTLNALDRVNQFNSNSDFHDLELVMALYLRFSMTAVSTVYTNNGTSVNWQCAIIELAARAKIELADQGVSEIEDLLAEYEILGLYPGKATATRWNWTKTVSVNQLLLGTKLITRTTKLVAYRDEHADGVSHTSSIGGFLRHFNILDMDSKTMRKRKEYHFDKKDPLENISSRDLAAAACGKLRIEVEELMDWKYEYSSRPQLDRPSGAPMRAVRQPSPASSASDSPVATITTTANGTYIRGPSRSITTTANGTEIRTVSQTISSSRSGTRIQSNGCDMVVGCDGKVVINGRVVVNSFF